jgi:hypothetical protein
MPRTVRTEQPADALAQLHADPDDRPGLLDGLIVEGRDLFAARRRASRERISGPDPRPSAERSAGPRGPADAAAKLPVPPPRKETSTVATVTSPVLPPPSTATRANGATWRIISEAEWAALKRTKRAPQERWTALLGAVAHGDIICIPVPHDISRKGAIMSLHRTARGCGLRLEIRSCPNGELAVAAITPQESQP